MRLTGDVRGDMARDLAGSLARGAVRQEMWCVDQELINERLEVRVGCGLEARAHIARSRVDRCGMKVPETLIDFHAPKEPMRHRTAIHAALLRAFGAAYGRSEIAKYGVRGLTAHEPLDRFAAEDKCGFLRPHTSGWDTHRVRDCA